MPFRPEYRPIPGSEKSPAPGASVLADANPNEVIDVTLLLRRRADPPQAKTAFSGSLAERKYATREEFRSTYGAGTADIKKVEQFAYAFGLAVAEEHPGRRTVKLRGTVAAFSQALDVSLRIFQHESGTYRGRTGAINVPAELDKIVVGAFGLDNRPVAKPHMRFRKQATGFASPLAAGGSFTPLDLANIYNFPAGDGAGQSIAIIELGGGYSTTDLNTYFQSLNLTPPSVTAVSVDGGANMPGDPNGADAEVMLDIEVAGAIAPKASIVVYFAPNTDQGFLDAINSAVHDTTNNPSIVSISWGGPESSWTQQSLNAYDSAFADAGMMGVSVCVAAGDQGSTDGVTDGLLHVDFPAASPNVLGCGGTNLQVANGSRVEVVWNELANGEGATGGGVSSFFAVPSYQSGLQLPNNSQGNPGRAVPDVAGDADPATGYVVRVDGQDTVIGGTSAVAPLYAGLLARINQAAGKPVGFASPLLYAGAPKGFNDITQGTNGDSGVYAAGPGYDCCTGLGTPDGTNLASVLTASGGPAPAGG